MTGLKALLILLLPACVCGGLLAIGDRADGLKLMALSLFMVLPWMLLTRTATGESWGSCCYGSRPFGGWCLARTV